MLKYVRIVHKSLCIFLSTSVVEDPWLSFHSSVGLSVGICGCVSVNVYERTHDAPRPQQSFIGCSETQVCFACVVVCLSSLCVGSGSRVCPVRG